MILPEDEVPRKTGRVLPKIYSVSIQLNCVTEAKISILCHEVFVEKKTKVILKVKHLVGIFSSKTRLKRWGVAPFLGDRFQNCPWVSLSPLADLLGHIYTLLHRGELGYQLGDMTTLCTHYSSYWILSCTYMFSVAGGHKPQ